MEQGFIDILQKLIDEQGKETLFNASKCKAFLADYTKGEYKKESRFLLQALEAGTQKAIDTTNELAICKKQQIRVLREDYFLDEKIAMDVVDMLALVLRGDTATVKQTISESGNEMVFVPGGSFQMGDTAGGGYEKPVHTVTLRGFHIGKYEVTQKLYESVMESNPSEFIGGNLPVENVSWYDAVEFCNKLSEKEGLMPFYSINKTIGSDANNFCPQDKLKWLVTQNTSADGYRLPTEAEWEYTAKGGNGSPGNYKFAGNNDADSVAWYRDNGGDTTHDVGTKTPNGLGIYDMSGNVCEWCWDWDENYPNSPQTNPTGGSSGFIRVFRGGNWGSSARGVRSACRYNACPTNRYNTLGFRLVYP